jgi:DinB superfamily
VTIEPETKNWTWVLERRCDECGFDAQAFPSTELGRLTRESGEPWRGFLANSLVRTRPAEDCWSALEYSCHVRDVFRLAIYRVQRMLHEDDPQFENWDQDETAVSDHYDTQDPMAVADEIVAAATQLGDLYDTVRDDQWDRPGTRSDGSHFTVDSFGRYLLHDPVHHIVDVERGYASLSEPRP